MSNPLNPGGHIRAVLFDVDGTLYDQRRMRRLMAMELATGLLLAQPFAAARRLRALREFRRAQEHLRHAPQRDTRLDAAQIDLAATRAGVPADEVSRLVREWMDERPLKHLARCAPARLRDLFAFLAAAGVGIGAFSDYPAAGKLEALGIADFCSIVLCASDPEISAFKPNPRGFIAACERWGLPPAEVLMVGDRTDADAAGAAAAGMPCVIVNARTTAAGDRPGVMFVDSLERLLRVLDDRHR